MSAAPVITPSQEATPPAPRVPGGPAPGRLALGLLLVLLGGGWLIETLGIAEVRWQTVLAAAVLGIGGLLLATGHRGGADGLIGLGIILSIVLIATAAMPQVPVTGGLGDRDVRPTTIAELEPTYELTAGTLVIDLRELDLPFGSTEVSGRVGAGELIVRLPDDAEVAVEASSGAGEVDVLGRRQAGIGPTLSVTAADGSPQLVLELSVGLGTVVVTR
jgi:hypothetical protein